jgi:hypothetical protein
MKTKMAILHTAVQDGRCKASGPLGRADLLRRRRLTTPRRISRHGGGPALLARPRLRLARPTANSCGILAGLASISTVLPRHGERRGRVGLPGRASAGMPSLRRACRIHTRITWMLFALPWPRFGKTEDSLATGSPRVIHGRLQTGITAATFRLRSRCSRASITGILLAPPLRTLIAIL